MITRRVATSVVLALFAHSPAVAAQDSTSARAWSLFGAGVNLNGGSATPVAMQLGREWRGAGSRLGIRLSAEYTAVHRGATPSYSSGSDYSFGTTETHEHRTALSLLSTVALAKGRVQPYLLSGFMLEDRRGYHTVRLNAYDPPPEGIFRLPARDTEHYFRGLGLGFEAGFGLQARIGSTWFYTEMRRSVGDGSSYNSASHVRPLTVGIHFDE